MELDVVAVVVTHNSSDALEGLLDSIGPAMGALRHVVVVVDNGSSDDSVSLARGREGVLVVEQANNGYSAGINAGVARGPRSEAVLVLNPDVRLDAGSVEHLMRRLRSTGAGIVAPKTVDGNGELSFSLRREPSLLRAAGFSFTGRRLLSEYVQEPREYASPHVVTWAVGAVMLVSRACHDALSGWDESYFLYSEETDLCLRAADAGWSTFYEPAAVVTHLGGGSGRSGRTHAMQSLNRVRLYARRHSAPMAWTYFVLTIISELSWVLRGGEEARSSVRALVRPGRRPEQLGLNRTLLPR